MNCAEAVAELKTLGNDGAKRVLMKHGAREPFFGVKVEDLKRMQKRIGCDHALALALYGTGISDAMYLAGMIADDAKMSKSDLQRWANEAYWYMLSEYTVPGVAADGPHGFDVARKWLESPKENIASAGWATWCKLVGVKADQDLDLEELKVLLERVGKTIHAQSNRVRYTMNGFVIAAGGYVKSLTKLARKTAEKIGEVKVEMGETACKVPDAGEYLLKMEKRGVIGKKRDSAKC